MEEAKKPVTMDYHQMLSTVINTGYPVKVEPSNHFIFNFLPEALQKQIGQCCIDSEDSSTSRQYLQTLLHLLENLHNVLSKSEMFMSVPEYRSVKTAIEHAISIGVFPSLLPGISKELKKLYPLLPTPSEDLPDLIKYSRLSATVKSLILLNSEVALKPAILTQLGPLLAALLQLSHAPLMQPQKNLENCDPSKFQMTPDLYKQLTTDQKDFQSLLTTTISNCPQAAVIKELMVLFGLQETPHWLKKHVKNYLVNLIMQRTGIYSLITATCQDTEDLGIHWDKLETISNLIAVNHGHKIDEYYSKISQQILDLISSTTVRSSSEIATICIKALLRVHPAIAQEKIIDKLCAPLLVTTDSSQIRVTPKSESEISECLEKLTKLFTTSSANFKCLPVSLIAETAVPLFCMFKKTRESPSVLRRKSKDLLLVLLNHSEQTDALFGAFLGHNIADYYGLNLEFKFGPTGGLETTGEIEETNPESSADCLLDLIKDSIDLPWHLFNYLQKYFCDTRTRKVDVIDELERQLALMKLLLTLASTKSVQEHQLRHPEHLIAFITSLFNESSSKLSQENDEVDILYVSLMLIKEIISEKKKPKDWSWTPFENLSKFLQEKLVTWKARETLKVLIDEVRQIIRQKGASPRFVDLSIDDTYVSAFDKALKDLADPLLPVRAHGLITLTKLVETNSPTVDGKADLLVYLFQENLKDEDSFVYLAAINGLCALALKFPQKVIEILIQEFTEITRNDVTGVAVVAPENRAKLGEILVKTTRLLGEMAPVYRNVLINGFLCAIRDSDPMVRASSLSCLGELCSVLGFALGNSVVEILYCIGCVIETDKFAECRRAAVLVVTLLIRGLGKDVLENVGSELLSVYRGLKQLRDNDGDPVLRLHAQLALEELDDIVKSLLFVKPEMEKRIFLLK